LNSFPGPKQPKREADQSPPSNAEDKNAWSCTTTTPYSASYCLVMHRDYFRLGVNQHTAPHVVVFSFSKTSLHSGSIDLLRAVLSIAQ
jgi:hypothetical protein